MNSTSVLFGQEKIVSLFNGINANPAGKITIGELVEGIRSGRWKSQIESLRKLKSSGNGAYDKAKINLQGVTLSGEFSHRDNGSLIHHSELMQIDIDEKQNPCADMAKIKKALRNDPYIFFVCDSPGKDIKAAIRIKPNEHRATFLKAERYFMDKYGVKIDAACKDVSRLCFITYDPQIRVKEDVKILKADKPKSEPPKPPKRQANGLTPWDDFNQRGDIGGLLESHGWARTKSTGKTNQGGVSIHFRRPGKRDGHSAGLMDGNLLKIWSSNAAPFEPDQTYNPFSVYALLECNGDHTVAGRRLSKQGYGDQQVKTKPEPPTETWEPPTDLKSMIPAAPVFPLEALPEGIRNYIADESHRMQVSVDFLAIPLLGNIAGCIGKWAVIRPKRFDNWEERPCIWGGIISDKSTMKSPALKAVMSPLNKIQAAWAEEDKGIIAQWEKDAAIIQKREKAHQRQCEKILNRDPGAKLPPKPEQVEAMPEKPIIRRIITNDPTIEKAARIMVDSRGLTLVRDELSGFMLNMNRYSNGSDRQFWLETYSGGSYQVDRVKESFFVPDLYCNIVGGIQPKKAREIFSDASDDGFFDRFGLIAYPEKKESWEYIDRKPDKAVKDRYHEMCQRLAETDFFKESEAGKTATVFYFDPEAQEIFKEWLTDHMKRLKAMDADDPTIGFRGKQRGLVCRIALILHLASWADGETSEYVFVSEKTLLRALAIVDVYLPAMWNRITAAFGKTNTDDGASKLADWIKRKNIKEFTIRDIKRKGWKEFKHDENTIRLSIDELINHRWVSEPTAKTSKKGGRPTDIYRVNPMVIDNAK